MNTAYIPLLSAFIGAVAGIIGGGLTARKHARLERDKWKRNINDTFRSELRTCIRELTTKIAAAIHSMCWLCWLAKFGADRLTQEQIDQYDNEIHTLLPQITGYHAVMASMDFRAYELFKPLISEIIQLDDKIGQASLIFKPGNSASAKHLADLHLDYLDLETKISRVVSEAVRPYSIEQ